jgi:hypothetical protein
MPAKQRRRLNLVARVNLQVGRDTDCLVDSSAAIDTHPLPQLDQPLLIRQVMLFPRHRITECQLLATMVGVGDQSSLRWTLLIRIGGKLGATI